jgi:Mrp family chromosome partitioning ATPase
MPEPTTLLPLVESRRVLVCAGAGGVGKTTVAAALALGAARNTPTLQESPLKKWLSITSTLLPLSVTAPPEWIRHCIRV